jgi:hypothetical protein
MSRKKENKEYVLQSCKDKDGTSNNPLCRLVDKGQGIAQSFAMFPGCKKQNKTRKKERKEDVRKSLKKK